MPIPLSRRTVLSLVVAPLALSRPLTAQAPTATAGGAVLVVAGDVAKPLHLSLADLKAMPRTRAEVKTEDGTVNVYEGVLAGEVLKAAGVGLGGQMRGAAAASYVLASASDGYQALFAIAELDPAFTPSEIVIADTIDGKALFDYQGPLRLVAPHDLRGARSVRMLQRIEVVRLKK